MAPVICLLIKIKINKFCNLRMLSTLFRPFLYSTNSDSTNSMRPLLFMGRMELVETELVEPGLVESELVETELVETGLVEYRIGRNRVDSIR